MSRRKEKIKTDGGPSLEENPFGALDALSLPERGSQRGTTTSIQKDTSNPVTPTKKKPNKIVAKGRVEIRREKAGRGGKTVTTLSAFPTHLPLSELAKLAFDLKQSCACGGTQKGRVIELQGDVCDQAMSALSEKGFQPVRAGG